MNLVLKNIFRTSTKFFPVQDVYAGFNLLKDIPEVNLVIIDLDDDCSGCIDFIYFITSSKVYKRNVIVLASDSQYEKINEVGQFEHVQVYTKPFNPEQLVLNNFKHLISAPQ